MVSQILVLSLILRYWHLGQLCSSSNTSRVHNPIKVTSRYRNDVRVQYILNECCSIRSVGSGESISWRTKRLIELKGCVFNVSWSKSKRCTKIMNYDENSYLKEQRSTFLTSTVHGKILTIEVYNKLRAQLILRLKHHPL